MFWRINKIWSWDNL